MAEDTKEAVERLCASTERALKRRGPPELTGVGDLDAEEAIAMLLRLLTRAEAADAAGHARGVREAAEACAKSAAHYREMIKRGHHAETFSAIAQALDGQAQALIKPAPAATDEGKTP